MKNGTRYGRETVGIPVALRLAVEDDLPVLEWYGQFTHHREVIATAFRMQREGTGAMLLADVNGFPAGQVWIDFARKRHAGIATLWAVRVFDPFQGLSLGTRLMRAAERLVVERGMPDAELGVDRDNAGVIRFYERLGYTRAGEESGSFRYRTPDGAAVEVAIDQWLLRKRLRGGTRPPAAGKAGTAAEAAVTQRP